MTVSVSADLAGPARAEPAPLTVLDLFAGAGGLTAGLDRTHGFRTVAAVEMDVAAAATYASNHTASVFAGPIQDWLRQGDVPRVDVVVGGPPCQGFSTLGKQDVEDERNALWREYAATVARARPDYFVLENVGAFMKSGQFQQLQQETERGRLLQDYTFQARVLNAADYGAFQNRKRVVAIGHRRSTSFPGWPPRTHAGRHLTVREAFRGVPVPWSAIELPPGTIDFGGVSLPGPFPTSALHLGRQYRRESLLRFATIPPGGNRFNIPADLLAECWKKHKTGSGDVMGRLHWDKPAVTIRTEFFKPEKGRYLHPEANRAITHLEAALLQGFPLDYKWVGSKTAIARQIGNAVPIPLAEAIGNQLLRAVSAREN